MHLDKVDNILVMHIDFRKRHILSRFVIPDGAFNGGVLKSLWAG